MKTRLLLFLLVITSFANAQTVTTFAGSGTAGYVDATEIAAQFSLSYGIATDAAGNVYVSDSDNHKIRKITPAGVVTTLAGSTAGFVDGTGAAARFFSPQGIVVDASGNVYVADTSNQRIRKITPAGVVTTIAGSGATGTNDAMGTSAQFNQPYGLALDGNGKLYIADRNNHRIRMLWLSTGLVQTIVGGTQGYGDATGTSAQFNSPQGLIVDASGNIFVSDTNNHRIRKITPGYVVTTFAGGGAFGFADGTGTAAIFGGPWGITIDSAGNLYVGDTGNNRIRKITPTADVTTLAGTGTFGYADGNGASAEFKYPYGVAINFSGDIYVADAYNYRIRKITITPLDALSISGVFVSSVTSNSATIDYTLFANNEATTSVVNYGVFSSALAAQTTGFSASGVAVTNSSVNLSGLFPSTTYYYQIVATNASGVTSTVISSFRTAAETDNGAPITEYNFNGTLNNITESVPFFNNVNNGFGVDRFGNANQALRISNAGISASIANLPLANAARTVSLWIKPSTSFTDNIVFSYGPYTANNSYGFSYIGSTVTNFTSGSTNLTGTATLPIGTWKHVVCTYSGTGVASVYIDGSLISTGSRSTWNTTNSVFYLGRNASLSTTFFGLIDDLKIYNYALSDAEVANLYTNNTLTSQNFNQNNLEVALYPNPANDVLNIETALELQSVEIYNIQGQKVKSANQKQINVSDLASGMYMVRIQDADNGIATKKFIKQ
uniref:LamG-like jellyroll fold domain-containing protein n=1 Tax=Flavobacterium sp. TaxID=239 RepID=UPI004049C03A